MLGIQCRDILLLQNWFLSEDRGGSADCKNRRNFILNMITYYVSIDLQ